MRKQRVFFFIYSMFFGKMKRSCKWHKLERISNSPRPCPFVILTKARLYRLYPYYENIKGSWV